MALKHVYGDFFHRKAVKERDPVAIQVKQLWSCERDPTYPWHKKAIVEIIGQQQWDVLKACQPTVGKEAFYRSVYDAIQAVHAPSAMAVLPPL